MSNKIIRVKNGHETPLNKLRCDKGLSIAELAKMMGVTPQVVDSWLIGKCCPREDGIKKLATALEVTPEYVLEAITTSKINKRNNTSHKSSRKMRQISNNFWSKLRKTHNITCETIAGLLDEKKDPTTVAKYFTGDCMPNDKIIQNICDIFDIDFEKGKQEFQVVRDKKLAIKKNTIEATMNPTSISDAPIENSTSKAITLIPVKNEQVKSIGKMIYNKVTFEEFWDILFMLTEDINNKNLPELLYGKVDYATFNKIQGVFDTL